jgi:hypothetical protein
MTVAGGGLPPFLSTTTVALARAALWVVVLVMVHSAQCNGEDKTNSVVRLK